MVENKWDTQNAKPMIPVIYTVEKRQLAVISSISKTQTPHYPIKINGAKKLPSEARAELKDVGVAGLIAQPIK